MDLRRIAFALAVSLFLTACASQPAVDLAAEEAAIRALEGEWLQAGQAKDLVKYVSYYAPDASIMFPNMALVRGPAAAQQALEPLMQTPGFTLTFSANKVVVASGGDMAYVEGAYETGATDPQGNPVRDTGKYVVVWRKQADGSWKVVADIFNSDLPVTPPAN